MMQEKKEDINGDKQPDKIEVRDKIHRSPPPKYDKNVSNSKSQAGKHKPGDGKPKQHVSRPIQKLKSGADRRSSSSQSQKRRRSLTPEDNTPNKSVSDESMHEVDLDTNLLCPECNKHFDKDDSCVFCECCARWFHAICQNISEEEVTAFKLLKDLAHYYCPNCKAGASELHKAAVDIRRRVDSIEKQVVSMQKDNETTKTDVKNLQTQQKTNTTKLKTLNTVHETLRKDVDSAQTDIKTIKSSNKKLKEDYQLVKEKQTSNTEKINATTTRLDTISDDIVNRINTIIDERIQEKVQPTENVVNTTPTTFLEDEKIKDAILKMIDAAIAAKVPTDQSLVVNEVKLAIRKEVNDKLEENFPFLPTQDMDVDESAIQNNSAPRVNPTFSSAVRNVISEQEEIRKRKLQVVITNVRENVNPDDDHKDAVEIFTMMGVNVPIVEAIRVGKKKNERPRVIRVTLQNLTDKRTLLSKATTLRNVPDDHVFSKVYVKPNLTHLQQEASKNLERQLKEVRLKNPQTTYKISQGKIVVVTQNN